MCSSSSVEFPSSGTLSGLPLGVARRHHAYNIDEHQIFLHSICEFRLPTHFSNSRMLNSHQFPQLLHRTHRSDAQIPAWATASSATSMPDGMMMRDHIGMPDNPHISYGGRLSSIPAPIYEYLGMPVTSLEGAEAADNMSLASAGAAQFSWVTPCQIPSFESEQLSMIDR